VFWDPLRGIQPIAASTFVSEKHVRLASHCIDCFVIAAFALALHCWCCDMLLFLKLIGLFVAAVAASVVRVYVSFLYAHAFVCAQCNLVCAVFCLFCSCASLLALL